MRSNLKLVPLQVAGKWAYTKQSGRGAARWVEIFGNFYQIACMVVLCLSVSLSNNISLLSGLPAR